MALDGKDGSLRWFISWTSCVCIRWAGCIHQYLSEKKTQSCASNGSEQQKKVKRFWTTWGFFFCNPSARGETIYHQANVYLQLGELSFIWRGGFIWTASSISTSELRIYTALLIHTSKQLVLGLFRLYTTFLNENKRQFVSLAFPFDGKLHQAP